MRKPASKVAEPAQIQPKSQFLFHKNLPLRDFSIMTLRTGNLNKFGADNNFRRPIYLAVLLIAFVDTFVSLVAGKMISQNIFMYVISIHMIRGHL